ncbi:MAG: type IX secretion system membrane protein PorP/SprF [Candidatus Neomarinimicrobiota bacterium]
MSLRMLLVFKLFLLGLTPLFAFGPQFLAVPVSARALASLRSWEVSPALSANPSRGPIMGFSYGSWLANTRSFSFRLSRNLKHGSAAFNIKYTGLDNLELRTEQPSDQALANFSAYGTAFEGVYNRQIGGLNLGAAFKILALGIYTKKSNGWAVDLGLEKQLTNFRLGFSILNLGRLSAFISQKPALPKRLITMAGYNYKFTEFRGEVTVLLEKSSIVNNAIFAIGNDLKFKNLSAGFVYRKAGIVQSLSAGIALIFGMYEIGYSYQFGNQKLGSPQIMDISLRLPWK